MMRVVTPLIFAGFVLLCGCAHWDEPHFTKGGGDAGQFIFEQAVQHGARPFTTHDLPTLAGSWRYFEDQYGVVVQLPSERFADVQSFLRKVFGPPTHEASETTNGGKLGWYAAKTIGIGLQFGYNKERTQVIILRPQPTSEIIKRIPDALERSKE